MSSPSGSSFWPFFRRGSSETKVEEKAETDNHVGLKEVSSTHAQIFMLKEQMKLLQRHNEELMNRTVSMQATDDMPDEDPALLKSQLAELRSRNAQLEEELTSQSNARFTTYQRPASVQRSANATVTPPSRGRRPAAVTEQISVKASVTPPSGGSSIDAPSVNLATAAAQVARKGLLKKSETMEDNRTRVDLTSVRPAGPRPFMRVRRSTVESEVCDLTGLRERQSFMSGNHH